MGLYIGYDFVSPSNKSADEDTKKIINGTINSITIPSDISNIREYAFYGCSNLTSVTISDNINSIGEYAFGNCPNLTSITIDQYEDSIPGAPWGAYNATINWKPMPDMSIDLTGFNFSINSNEVIVTEYADSNVDVILPDLVEE